MTEASVINGGALVVLPAKAVIWGCMAVIGVLVAGYVALFGWLAVEVVEIGRDVASIEAEVKVLREGQESIKAEAKVLGEGQESIKTEIKFLREGQERLEDILIEFLRQRNESQ